MAAPTSKRLPNFRRPRPRPSWGARLLDGWLMQHYALAVWMSTGVRFRRRQPVPFAKLVPIINYTISGQVIFTYVSLYFLIAGRGRGVIAVGSGIALTVAGLIFFILPQLEKRALRQSIPARFRKFSEGQRRRWAWTCFFLFWAAFYSILFVVASLD